MDSRTVRRLEQRLRDLNITIPVPLDPWSFVDHIAERRQRPIRLLDLDTAYANVACGLWVATKTADYIVVDARGPLILQGHILLHEIAHLLLDHDGQLPLPSDASAFEHLDPAMVRRVLARASRYSNAEERDAESFATVIKSFARHRSPVPRPRWSGHNDTPVAVADRFSSVLAGDRRWL